MDTTMDSSVPASSHVFHAPEIWVILQTLGAVAAGLEVPPEIASDPGAVQAAQTSLLEKGALYTDAAGRLTLAPEIEALIRPAAYPEIVFVANIADNAKTGKLARVMCFGWTPQALVVNWVDEANDHHFESCSPEEVEDCIWDHLSHVCDLDVDDPEPEQANPTAAELEQTVEQMRQSVMLMAANGIQSPEQRTHAIGWFVSGRTAWLMQKDEQGEQLAPSVAGQVGIAQAVSDFVEQAFSEGQPAAG